MSADYANFESELKRQKRLPILMSWMICAQYQLWSWCRRNVPHGKLVFGAMMVTNPEHHIEEFARAGADIISIHVEQLLLLELFKTRQAGEGQCRDQPRDSTVDSIKHVLNLVDQVTWIMTINQDSVAKPSCLRITMDRVHLVAALQ